MAVSESLARRFWAKVGDHSDPASCWEWIGGRTSDGYGDIRRGGAREPRVRAHRLAWEIANESSVPDGLFVCHACDNRPCVNPAHLWLGTNTDNLRDMTAKGRHARRALSGERHPQAKLTADRVAEIRALCAVGANRTAMAAQFAVSRSTIDTIVSGRTWRGIE